MEQEVIPYSELISFAAGEQDGAAEVRLKGYIETHPEAAAVVAYYCALRELVRYLILSQPPETVLNRARSLYRDSGSDSFTNPTDYSPRRLYHF